MVTPLPCHLVFVAGKSPIPMYQLLALQFEGKNRWEKIDILSNKTTKPYLEKAIDLAVKSCGELNISIHPYEDPSIGFDSIKSVLDAISPINDSGIAICPSLGPRSITIPMLWNQRSLWNSTLLKIVQGEMAFIDEELPKTRHIAPSLSFEEFLEFHNVSILETDENMKLIVDENQVKIGPFSSIQYDGFLRLNIDIRDAESYSDAKIFSRDIHASKLKLERLFGRNSFKLDTVIGSRHRLDASPNLTIEPLSSILTFHHFIDAKNLTMTCLTVYQIQSQYKPYEFKIMCYVDLSRGKSIEECSSEIKERLETTNLMKNDIESLFDSMHFISSTEISGIHSIRDIDSTSFHIIDSKGSVEGHIQLQSSFDSAQFKGTTCLGAYNPNNHTWSIETSSIEDKKGILKDRKRIIRLHDAYALSGWQITGNKEPRWNREITVSRGNILSDVKLLTSSYFINDQTTILEDGSERKGRLRILDPSNVKLALGGEKDSFAGEFISFDIHALAVSETPPYNVTWLPSGGIWLEVLCEMLMWQLFSKSEVEILYEPEMKLIADDRKSYTPEGVAQLSDGTHIVWEVKSVPTSLPKWKDYITQICEYGNLAPYRNTIPVIVHCDETPDEATVNLAKKSRVVLTSWWDIPEIGMKIREWCDDNGVSITKKIPSTVRNTEIVKRGEIIREFAMGKTSAKRYVHPTKQQITEWYTSLPEEDIQKFNSDPWNKTLKPHLPKIKNERVPIEKETTDSPVIEEEPPIIEDSNQMKDFILSQTPCAHKDLVLKLKLVENRKVIYGNKSLRQFLLRDMRDLVNVEGENNEMYIYPIREEE